MKQGSKADQTISSWKKAIYKELFSEWYSFTKPILTAHQFLHNYEPNYLDLFRSLPTVKWLVAVKEYYNFWNETAPVLDVSARYYTTQEIRTCIVTGSSVSSIAQSLSNLLQPGDKINSVFYQFINDILHAFVPFEDVSPTHFINWFRGESHTVEWGQPEWIDCIRLLIKDIQLVNRAYEFHRCFFVTGIDRYVEFYAYGHGGETRTSLLLLIHNKYVAYIPNFTDYSWPQLFCAFCKLHLTDDADTRRVNEFFRDDLVNNYGFPLDKFTPTHQQINEKQLYFNYKKTRIGELVVCLPLGLESDCESDPKLYDKSLRHGAFVNAILNLRQFCAAPTEVCLCQTYDLKSGLVNFSTDSIKLGRKEEIGWLDFIGWATAWYFLRHMGDGYELEYAEHEIKVAIIYACSLLANADTKLLKFIRNHSAKPSYMSMFSHLPYLHDIDIYESEKPKLLITGAYSIPMICLKLGEPYKNVHPHFAISRHNTQLNKDHGLYTLLLAAYAAYYPARMAMLNDCKEKRLVDTFFCFHPLSEDFEVEYTDPNQTDNQSKAYNLKLMQNIPDDFNVVASGKELIEFVLNQFRLYCYGGGKDHS